MHAHTQVNNWQKYKLYLLSFVNSNCLEDLYSLDPSLNGSNQHNNYFLRIRVIIINSNNLPFLTTHSSSH